MEAKAHAGTAGDTAASGGAADGAAADHADEESTDDSIDGCQDRPAEEGLYDPEDTMLWMQDTRFRAAKASRFTTANTLATMGAGLVSFDAHTVLRQQHEALKQMESNCVHNAKTYADTIQRRAHILKMVKKVTRDDALFCHHPHKPAPAPQPEPEPEPVAPQHQRRSSLLAQGPAVRQPKHPHAMGFGSGMQRMLSMPFGQKGQKGKAGAASKATAGSSQQTQGHSTSSQQQQQSTVGEDGQDEGGSSSFAPGEGTLPGPPQELNTILLMPFDEPAPSPGVPYDAAPLAHRNSHHVRVKEQEGCDLEAGLQPGCRQGCQQEGSFQPALHNHASLQRRLSRAASRSAGGIMVAGDPAGYARSRAASQNGVGVLASGSEPGALPVDSWAGAQQGSGAHSSMGDSCGAGSLVQALLEHKQQEQQQVSASRAWRAALPPGVPLADMPDASGSQAPGPADDPPQAAARAALQAADPQELYVEGRGPVLQQQHQTSCGRRSQLGRLLPLAGSGKHQPPGALPPGGGSGDPSKFQHLKVWQRLQLPKLQEGVAGSGASSLASTQALNASGGSSGGLSVGAGWRMDGVHRSSSSTSSLPGFAGQQEAPLSHSGKFTSPAGQATNCKFLLKLAELGRGSAPLLRASMAEDACDGAGTDGRSSVPVAQGNGSQASMHLTAAFASQNGAAQLPVAGAQSMFGAMRQRGRLGAVVGEQKARQAGLPKSMSAAELQLHGLRMA